MAGSRFYGFSLINVCIAAAAVAASLGARLHDLSRLYTEPLRLRLADFWSVLFNFLATAASYMGDRERIPRLDLPMEIGQQHTAAARVISFGTRRTARFDRQHVDQGWLAAA